MSLYGQSGSKGGVTDQELYDLSKQYYTERGRPLPTAQNAVPQMSVYNDDDSKGMAFAMMGTIDANNSDYQDDESISTTSCVCAFLTCVIVVLIFLIAVKGKNMSENASTKSQKFTYFTRPGCPHCTKFNPVWDEFVKVANADSNLKSNFEFRKVDCTNAKDSALCVKERAYGLQGVPHVVRVNATGKRLVFKGSRTVDALLSFVNEN
jgi:glutaredoxin